MYYARTKNGVIQDVIVLTDESLLDLFAVGFDSMIHVSKDMSPGTPGPGWTRTQTPLPGGKTKDTKVIPLDQAQALFDKVVEAPSDKDVGNADAQLDPIPGKV